MHSTSVWRCRMQIEGSVSSRIKTLNKRFIGLEAGSLRYWRHRLPLLSRKLPRFGSGWT